MNLSVYLEIYLYMQNEGFIRQKPQAAGCREALRIAGSLALAHGPVGTDVVRRHGYRQVRSTTREGRSFSFMAKLMAYDYSPSVRQKIEKQVLTCEMYNCRSMLYGN